jgi:hypothetical protein
MGHYRSEAQDSGGIVSCPEGVPDDVAAKMDAGEPILHPDFLSKR